MSTEAPQRSRSVKVGAAQEVWFSRVPACCPHISHRRQAPRAPESHCRTSMPQLVSRMPLLGDDLQSDSLRTYLKGGQIYRYVSSLERQAKVIPSILRLHPRDRRPPLHGRGTRRRKSLSFEAGSYVGSERNECGARVFVGPFAGVDHRTSVADVDMAKIDPRQLRDISYTRHFVAGGRFHPVLVRIHPEKAIVANFVDDSIK